MEIQVNYQDIKNSIRGQLNSVAESFVIIGYELKQVREHELYLQDGYKDIYEFAQAEFNLGKSNTSRFMAINDKFSIEGNSPALVDEYKEYGSSKLAEMLTLSEEELKLISEKVTVKEMREIKQMKQESEVVATSQQTSESVDFTQSNNDLTSDKNEGLADLIKLVIEFFRDKEKREMLKEIAKLDTNKYSSLLLQSEVINIVNPSEHLLFRKGFLTGVFEAIDIGIKINKFGQATNVYTYYQFYQAITDSFDLSEKDPWVVFYGESEETPKIKESAKEDIENDDKDNEEDNEEDNEVDTKDDKQAPKEVKKQDKKVETKKTTKTTTTVEKEIVEENIPGQYKVDDYPEYLPEDHKEDVRIGIPQNNINRTEEKEVKEVVHELKTASMYFIEVLNKTKRFELRKFDRDFMIGDNLKLLEYDNGEYTGRTIITEITYILSDYTGLTENYCILGLGEIYEN